MQHKTLKLTATAVLSSLAAISAQAADVELYGVIDTGIYWTDSDYSESQTTLTSGITRGSRVGLRGSEDLGNGYKAIFNLETGFNVDDGSFDNTKNRLFNRNAYLGLDTPYGEVRFGRVGALGSGVNGSIFLNSFTVFGNLYKECQALQIINHQVMRIDNAVRYESPNLNGMQFYAEYSNGVDGDDAVKDSEKDRYAAIGATYRSGPLRLVFVADNYFYKNNNRHFDRDDSQTYNFGLRYALDDITLYAAYQYGKNVEKVGNQMKRSSKTKTEEDKSSYYWANEGFDTHSIVVGVTADMMGGKLKVQTGYTTGEQEYFRESKKKGTRNNYETKADAWQLAVAYDYPLSKRTYLYAAAAYVDRSYESEEKGGKVYGDGKSDKVRSVMLGISHSF